MKNNFFTYKSEKTGNIAIGKIPVEMQNKLNYIKDNITNSFKKNNKFTQHIWYNDFNQKIKPIINEITINKFWNNLCDTNKCIIEPILEMNELYYSKTPNNVSSINLYGASGNYNKHTDCALKYNGITVYRVLIGLTDNNYVYTNFPDIKLKHMIKNYDYIAFDMNKSVHNIIKIKTNNNTDRIMLKLHFIVCDKCNYKSLNYIKKSYVLYEKIMRYFMDTGTNPETFYQFFIGLLCQLNNTLKMDYNHFTIYFILIFILSKNKRNILLILFKLYIAVVLFFWLRYKLYKLR